MTGQWRDRAPRMLTSDTGPNGEPLSTPVDRRWLWRLEHNLAVSAPMGGALDQLRLDLTQYLTETCEHHWRGYEADEVFAAHRQCLWCNQVDWVVDGAPAEDKP